MPHRLVPLLAILGLATSLAGGPAFPGAEGYGAEATGGAGGTTVHVTNLNDGGPGSLREAVSQPQRVVVFDVAGNIWLKSVLTLSDNLSILGQTAPKGGIGVYGQSTSVSNRKNVILRYLRFREGMSGNRGEKALGMSGAQRILIDHCSIEWGRWDDLGLTVLSHDITVQYCLIAEGIHPQSFGALIDDVERVTLSHNLWMSNESRNPKVKGTAQYINNVVYNWGGTGLCGGHSAADHWLDVIGNYFIAGPSSNARFAGQFKPTDHVYQEGNLVDLDKDGVLHGTPPAPEDFYRGDEKDFGRPTWESSPSQKPAIPVTVEKAADALRRVLAEAGASKDRDGVDQRLIAEASSFGRKGRTLPHTDSRGEALVGGLGPP